MVLEYGLFIAGKSTNSATGEVFNDINPATLENLAAIQMARTKDIERAIEAGEKGSKIWSETPDQSIPVSVEEKNLLFFMIKEHI